MNVIVKPQVLVGLIGNHDQVIVDGDFCDCGEFFAGENDPGRIVRTVDQDHLGSRCYRIDESWDVRTQIRPGERHAYAHTVGQGNTCGVDVESRFEHHDLIAGVHKGQKSRLDCLRSPGRDNDITIRIDGESVEALGVRGNCAPQFRNTRRGWILITAPVCNTRPGNVGDLGRSVGIREPLAEVDGLCASCEGGHLSKDAGGVLAHSRNQWRIHGCTVLSSPPWAASLVGMDDVIGPDEAVGDWHLSAAADEVLADIAERAAHSDAQGIDRAQIDALARVGLLGTALEPVARQREVAERIAMADASVWFCWAQHQTPLKTLETAVPGDHAPLVDEIKGRWLRGLQDGSYLGSVAFAHLRRPGAPNPVAERVHGGWEIHGTLDWVTSWDIADVMLLMVRGSGEYADKIICAYLAAGRDPAYLSGLHVHEPLKLLAMSGTHTRPMTLDGVKVPDTNVVALKEFDDWAALDAKKTVDVNPATFGIIRGAVAELAEVADKRGDRQMAGLAVQFAERAGELRRIAYTSMDEQVDAQARLDLRARALQMAVQASTAVVTARSGAAMRTGCSAERRVREAMFLQVQAQTAQTRAASLGLLASEN